MKRYTGRLLTAFLNSPSCGMWGWLSSKDFRDESSKIVICRFELKDVISGADIITLTDSYGGDGSEHDKNCTSAGVRCLHGELCGGQKRLIVEFEVEQVEVPSRDCVKKMVQRALTHADGSPRLDAEKHAMFETIPQLDERNQPIFEYVVTGTVMRWDARRIVFSREQ
jgi:hypothetical protein